MSSQTKRSRVFSRRWATIATLVAATALTAACNEPRFLIPNPTLRGITIPLPPPSYADDVLLLIDVEGNVPIGFEAPNTRAFLFEKRTGRGYFVYTDSMSFAFRDVLVDVTDNCLETWFVDGIDGEESTAVDYKVRVEQDAQICAEDTSCSVPDDLGACLCLEKWTVGC